MPTFRPAIARSAPTLQLVVTLGPASMDLAPALQRAGATHFRLNASHLSPAELGRSLERLRAALPEVPVVVDLQGAKMRLGGFEERAVRGGEKVSFSLVRGEGEGIPLPHPEIFRAVGKGQTITSDDGRMHFRVLDAGPERLETEALNEGVLRPRKGVNLLEHPVELEDLTQDDLQRMRVCEPWPDITFAYSFMTDGREAAWVRRRAPGCKVVGKVERRLATRNLHVLEKAVDTVWICRGDLGAQLGVTEMARFVASLQPSEEPPYLMAGQVLEHLTRHKLPTRSELCHVHDLLARGYAGVVLSDETAIGADPLNAVEQAASMLAEYY
jgi:pyruvate kinase